MTTTAPDYTAVISHFAGVEPRGEGRWTARCPGHDDRRSSLSIWVGRNGKLIVGCHAGCDKRDLLKAAGLTFKDLDGTGSFANLPARKKRIVATYDYRDEFGELLYQTVRYDPKDFRQRQPIEGGNWQWNLDGCRRVLYRLPQLLQLKPHETIWIVEGEKDADTLWRLGIPATTRVCGARSPWLAEWNAIFRDRQVVIVPDNDAAGELSAATIAGALVVSGVVRGVTIARVQSGFKDVTAIRNNLQSANRVHAELERMYFSGLNYKRGAA